MVQGEAGSAELSLEELDIVDELGLTGVHDDTGLTEFDHIEASDEVLRKMDDSYDTVVQVYLHTRVMSFSHTRYRTVLATSHNRRRLKLILSGGGSRRSTILLFTSVKIVLLLPPAVYCRRKAVFGIEHT
jgi:hypothetical protein